jgi:hypothetical protein
MRALETMVDERESAAQWRFLLDEEDSMEDDFDDMVGAQLEQVRANRYLARPPKYRKRVCRWEASRKSSHQQRRRAKKLPFRADFGP